MELKQIHIRPLLTIALHTHHALPSFFLLISELITTLEPAVTLISDLSSAAISCAHRSGWFTEFGTVVV